MDMYKKQILWVVHSAEEHPCRENMFWTIFQMWKYTFIQILCFS